mgnify:CR=1 FL=1
MSAEEAAAAAERFLAAVKESDRLDAGRQRERSRLGFRCAGPTQLLRHPHTSAKAVDQWHGYLVRNPSRETCQTCTAQDDAVGAMLRHAGLACIGEDAECALGLAREKLRANVERPRRRLPDPFTPRAGRIAREPRRMNEGPLSVYDRAGQPCYECKTLVVSASQGTPAQGNTTPRITYWCPTCQPRRG